MRVITGKARGRKLKTLQGDEVRPTADRVKEAVFSVIAFDIPKATVLDLFAGSGQLGIEALSRGADYCVFVDFSRAAIDVVRDNLTLTGLISSSRIVAMDSFEYLKNTKQTFNIALLDPPYKKGYIEAALPLLSKVMLPGGLVICEHEKGLSLPESCDRLRFKKKYKYGKIEVSIFEVPI